MRNGLRKSAYCEIVNHCNRSAKALHAYGKTDLVAKQGPVQARVAVSAELAKLVGSGPHTPISVTKKLWKYIEEHDLLLDAQPPMRIRPDKALSTVLATKQDVDMVELTRRVNQHIRSSNSATDRTVIPRVTARKTGVRRHPSPRHWLWVTRPEFFEHEDGSSAITLGPQEGWWTCSADTKAGDLVLLYRAKTRRDIAYLILATTDAFSILKDPFAQERGWEWACEYDVLYEFRDPIPLSVLRANKEFWDWSPLRMNLQGRVFSLDAQRWERLVQLALPSNPGLAKFVGIEPGFSAPERIMAERALEDSLAADLAKLRVSGWDLELWRDPTTGRSGRQFVCAAAGGRIDLLCRDRASGELVVVELKNVLATDQTYLQTWRYVSWVRRFIAHGQPVSALVVARGCDSRFELMTEASERRVRFLSLHDVGFH